MSDIKTRLSKAWQSALEYWSGQDHKIGLFHLNKKQLNILKDEYLLIQNHETVKSLYLPNGVEMPTENYYIRHLDGSPLTPENILEIQHKRKAIKSGTYPPAPKMSL